MNRSVFFNKLPGRTRAAIAESGRLCRFLVMEDHAEVRRDDVFLGRITSVNRSIQAAFVDIGLKQPAFLNQRHAPPGFELKQGRTLPVQVTQPAYDGKQVRVSAQLRLCGAFCVLLSTPGQTRFSRDFKGDRKKWWAELSDLLPSGDEAPGWIIRAAAETAGPDRLQAEARSLAERFAGLRREAESGKARLIQRVDPIQALLIDEFKFGVDRVYCDDEAQYRTYRAWAAEFFPELVPQIQLHRERITLFDTYKISSQLTEALAPRVWLKSGGYADLHQTPAMVTVDVNSGKNTKKRGESAFLSINLEAVEAVFHQIRLRNLSGLIVFDFISMNRKADRKTLETAMRRQAELDRERLEVLPLNAFCVGMVSRERTGPDLNRVLNRKCSACSGYGWTRQPKAVALDIQQEILRDGAAMQGETLVIAAGSELAAYLRPHHELLFASLERQFGLTVVVQTPPGRKGVGYQIELK